MKPEQITGPETLSDPEKREKAERYARLNRMAKKNQILFAGSSLMEQFPVYEFLLNDGLPLTIYNRGIGGYTTQELLSTMDLCIFDLEPAYIYINIGTNDLNADGFTMEGLMERYREILTRIRNRLPDTKLFLLAYYPVNAACTAGIPWAEEALKIRTNERIRLANREVEALAKSIGATYLDLNAGITDQNGCLKAEYTVEGMHMYADGYAQVWKKLKNYLPKP